MAEFPAMPLWTDAHLADTMHLSAVEQGAYFLLLMSMWRSKNQSLPNDDRQLARLTRLSLPQWRRIKPVLMAFMHEDETGQIYQARLRDEYHFVKQRSLTNKRKAHARWLKNNKSDDAVAFSGQCPDDAPTPTPTPTPTGMVGLDPTPDLTPDLTPDTIQIPDETENEIENQSGFCGEIAAEKGQERGDARRRGKGKKKGKSRIDAPVKTKISPLDLLAQVKFMGRKNAEIFYPNWIEKYEEAAVDQLIKRAAVDHKDADWLKAEIVQLPVRPEWVSLYGAAEQKAKEQAAQQASQAADEILARKFKRETGIRATRYRDAKRLFEKGLIDATTASRNGYDPFRDNPSGDNPSGGAP